VSRKTRENAFRSRLETVIFEADTPLGKLFDIVLLWTIVLSILLVMLESVPSIRAQHGALLRDLEWFFTGLFTLEYIARLYSAKHLLRYATSFFGVVDLLAIIPGYLSLLIAGSQYLLAIRALRLLRIFRILKLSRYLGEASVLSSALRASRYKITVFLLTVMTLVVIMGSVMHLVEGPQNGFTSIPISIYWAIVTLTTVGYGDISPKTPLGQMISSALMIVGYGIIAVPTGIVTAELSRFNRPVMKRCEGCGHETHDPDAAFCKRCGTPLPTAETATPP
jgi:voltage-gated potassium channel